ncbi:hypothetical protein BC829DRAFT_178592 [Chytridium lagenaria]|nr:hypothetical protein BC829DRAFT_178592 [Chytridium lagenaria]
MAFGTLHDEVEKDLLFLQKTCDIVAIAAALPGLSEGPNYYYILYSYYVSKGRFREASSLMYLYATKLGHLSSAELGGKSIVSVTSEQGRAYVASINALALVDADFAWISPLSAVDVSAAGKGRNMMIDSYDDVFDIPDDSDLEKTYTWLLDIRKEYSLCLAKIVFSEMHRDYRFTSGLPRVEDAIALFVSMGDFDTALSMSALFGLDFQRCFDVFAARCSDPSYISSLVGLRVPDSFDSIIASTPSASQRAWRILRLFLDEVDTTDNGMAYRDRLVQKISEHSESAAIPLWLESSLKALKPDSLLRLYLLHDNLVAASNIALELIEQASTTDTRNIVPKHFSKYLPYLLLDNFDAKAAYNSEESFKVTVFVEHVGKT